MKTRSSGSVALTLLFVAVVSLTTQAQLIWQVGNDDEAWAGLGTGSCLQIPPPDGLRGSGADLAQFRWPAPEGYYDFADENVLIVTVVEDTKALSRIEEIAATPGIDVIFIGTSDSRWDCAVNKTIRS